jgi:peroxiredoxin
MSAMRSRSAVVGLMLLVVAPVARAASLPESIGVPVEPQLPTVQRPLSTGSPTTFLEVGDTAPAFSYLDTDGRWHSFDRLLDRGPVLLLFGATDDDLRGIERARNVFVDLGTLPVVAMDRRAGSAAKLARSLDVSSPVISDPRCAIASLFNSLDPVTHRHSPAFFVLDGKRTVRMVGHGALPATMELVSATARGLGKALPPSAFTLSAREAAARE